MQKVINGIALFAGVVALGVVGAGGYVYLNKDALVESAKEKITKAVTSAVTGSLPGLVDSKMPSLPSTTGPAVPGVGSVGGSALPF